MATARGGEPARPRPELTAKRAPHPVPLLAGPGLAFVGRAREFAALHRQLEAAFAGAGGVAMLVGEAGIGKTRTAQEFAAEAGRRGACVLAGRCYEGEWSPPFGPWVEALGRYAQATDPERLRRDLGLGAPAVGQLVPAVRAVLPDVRPPAPLGVEEERVRVQDAVTQFLLALARRRPLVLVLDDLNWADPASLGLLRYLARFLPEAGLLVVGTYRDEEVGSRHPLTAALADLRREVGYGHLPLTGLSLDETRALLAHAAQREIAPALARTIHAETSGNPFFAREVLRHLLEEGRFDARDDGRAAAGHLAEAGSLGIPEGVRQVVGRRLARLSDAANRMLGHAAIFTGGFDFRVLQALTDMPEGQLLDALDEALASGLIRPVDGRRETYDFVHAIVRHTLDAEWSPSRRVRLHRQAAEALARVHAGREMEYAAELAVQYHESLPLPGATKGILYAVAAAERARAIYARDQVVTFLRMARDLATEAELETRGTILCRLAIAEAEALQLEAAPRTVNQALAALADAGAAPETVASFLGTVAAALKESGARAHVWHPLVRRGLGLVTREHGPSASSGQALAWARLQLLPERYEPISTGAITTSRWCGLDPEAVAIVRRDGDEDDYARTLQPLDFRTRDETVAIMERARR